MPKVSVCIPAYNQAEHLKKTIDSVLCQTYTDYEIVITDDSPGNIVKNLVDRYQLPSVIKYHKNNRTLGSPANWNEAVLKASGEYIKIIHHDDWFNYDYSLARYVRLLDENMKIDFAFSATEAIVPFGKDYIHELSTEQMEALKENPLLLYASNLIGAPSNTIVRNNSELKFDTHLKWLVDVEYYLRQIGRNRNLVYTNEILMVTYLAEGRVSDECIDNKDVEISEYLYLLNKLNGRSHLYSAAAFRKCLLKAIEICNRYGVRSVANVAACGYKGNIHQNIKTYFTLNSFSTSLGKLYLKFLRRG